jgi:hypothetical protein
MTAFPDSGEDERVPLGSRAAATKYGADSVPACPLAVFVAALLSLVILLISRLYYAPKYLFGFDNANFALAMRHFDPAMHQPQPPGYPMFVALLDLINPFAGDANRSLIVAGVVSSAAALVLLWLWTDQMFGRDAAYLSTALLILHPVFWVAGVANPVRVFLAVATVSTGFAAWRTIRSATPLRAFFVAAAVLGLVAGFRPETLVLLAPMWLAVGIYRKLGPAVLLVGALILSVTACVWLGPMAVRMGGISRMLHVFADYVRANSIDYTAAYGAPARQSLITVRKAIEWSLGMTVIWIWVLPFVWRRFTSFWDTPRILLTAVALLPALMFHTLVHVRDVDQTLVEVPISCLIGGVALAAIPSRTAVIAAVLWALVSSYWFFRRPLSADMQAASRSAIRYLNDWTRSTYRAFDELGWQPGTVVIWYDAVVPWRNISYYYPDFPLLVIRGEGPFWVHQNQSENANREPDGALILPRSADHVVLGLSYAEAARAERQWPGARRVGPLICLDLQQVKRIQIGAVVLHANR